eukprot:7536480-Ditylum_brightwellii.AAC.1
MQESKERKSKMILHEVKGKGCECHCNNRDKKHQGHKEGLQVAKVRSKEEMRVPECKVCNQTEERKLAK